jgi:hypothetical protein
MELEMNAHNMALNEQVPNMEPPNADSLSRVVKMALDTGEVETVAAGYELFQMYRLGVLVGAEARESPAHQAALLTVVNTARRAMLGGVMVAGNVDAPLLVSLPECRSLHDAVVNLGGRLVRELPDGVPILTVGGNVVESKYPLSLAVTFEDWRGGVIPTSEGRRLREARAITPAAVLAGAIAVSEVFQHLRGNPMAGERSVGLSLWSPEYEEWETAPSGPSTIVLPSRLWLLGLGHLGQAYLWTLGLLPYENPDEMELVLQDFDRITTANDSTSILTTAALIGQRKTRAMAAWAEARGFQTRLVERLFPGGMKVADDEPRLALGGVDNEEARAAYEDAGFECVIEAGLGAGPTEYLAFRLHSFPASTTAWLKWGGPTRRASGTAPRTQAYEELAAEGMDECGLVRLSTRTVGAPFVGVTAATLVIAEVLRLLNDGPRYEVIDMTLHDPASRAAVSAQHRSNNWNPGYTRQK